MFEKLTGKDKIIERINQIEKTIKSLEGNIDSLSDKIKKQNQEFNSFLSSKEEIINKFSSLIEESNLRFNEELLKFQNLRKKGLSSSLEDLKYNFKKMIEDRTEDLEIDIKSHEDLKKNISSLSGDIEKAKHDLKRFFEISEKIKSKDFEMKNLIDKVENLSKQNVFLEKNIEGLKSVIAKERRRFK